MPAHFKIMLEFATFFYNLNFMSAIDKVMYVFPGQGSQY
ncbi:uncharacterized protein METZ01_LOCUS50445, partial [marine metagenome]